MADAFAVDRERGRDGRAVAELLEDPERPRLFVLERLADVAQRGDGNAGGRELRLPLGARARAQPLGQQVGERRPVAYAVGIGAESLVVR